jgi:hypothetical protein
MANLRLIEQQQALVAWLKTPEGVEQARLLMERTAALKALRGKATGLYTVGELRLINKALDKTLTIENMWSGNIRLNTEHCSRLTKLAERMEA